MRRSVPTPMPLMPSLNALMNGPDCPRWLSHREPYGISSVTPAPCLDVPTVTLRNSSRNATPLSIPSAPLPRCRFARGRNTEGGRVPGMGLKFHGHAP